MQFLPLKKCCRKSGGGKKHVLLFAFYAFDMICSLDCMCAICNTEGQIIMHDMIFGIIDGTPNKRQDYSPNTTTLIKTEEQLA